LNQLFVSLQIIETLTLKKTSIKLYPPPQRTAETREQILSGF